MFSLVAQVDANEDVNNDSSSSGCMVTTFGPMMLIAGKFGLLSTSMDAVALKD
jgi:hypothetical protein